MAPAAIERTLKFARKFFYTFLDIRGILLGVFLIAVGGWVVTGHSLSEGLGVVVLILGIAAFMIYSGHYFQFKITRWIFVSAWSSPVDRWPVFSF